MIFLVLSALVAIFVTTWTTFALSALNDLAQGESPLALIDLINPLAWALILLWGAFLALIPTTVLLGIAFASARRFGAGCRVVGLIAGLVHACAGNAVKFADLSLHDPNSGLWPTVATGFGLIEMLPGQSGLLVIPSSALGGWFAGAFFARLIRPIPALPNQAS
ncbi:hypothetical protein KYN89_14470 [Alteriqipengyuania sp. NZ-12B]|uniref:Uncharacterized protein n=1 Tax=Alteriqipengyuania abyssalis TaxID=2860200 RepID=A0ABS7PGQ5_9SPHN|nr:hypothetical protein [Alteriqipengyuania abyssalis]MBY8338251.1 hypothetical protein [Alteriqipengyuania abyssalis]